MLHVAKCARQGLRKRVFRTVDTYVVVLAIVRFGFMNSGSALASEALENIDRFIVGMYCRPCSVSGVNEARKELFAQGYRTMENIPPTKAALR